MFPKNFVWGAATSSYQIEGGTNPEEGRGECIWTRFSHTSGRVRDNHNGDVACDHYHLYVDDITLMKQLGLDAYRFSFSWPRVLPAGTGSVNPKGLAFYDRLVDKLLETGLTPFATLYHWDLPQALQDKGGWVNPEIVNWFGEYTHLMTTHFGDRIKQWTTHNEPYVVAFVGHHIGRHAPGVEDLGQAYVVAHHLLLSHAHALPIIRANVPEAQAGIVVDIWPAYPHTDSEQDKQAAQRFDDYHNRWFLDPLFKGHYPAEMVEFMRPYLSGIDDLTAVSQAQAPIDFLGINYYTRGVVAYDESSPFKMNLVLPEPHIWQTTMKWEVFPQGLRDMLVGLHQEYSLPAVYITENGSAWPDQPPAGEILEDPERVTYLAQHLQAIEEAIAQGVPMQGYFAWSLMDNFEWGHGYHQRFGLIYVDFATQKRTLKRSALAYAEHILKAKSQ